MKILSLILAGTILVSCTKTDFTKKYGGISSSHTLYSSNTNTEYRLDVYYPDSQFPSNEVPVVYLLDGFWWQESAIKVIKEQSENGTIPKCILVSLDYTSGNGGIDRRNDLVYQVPNEDSTRIGAQFYLALRNEIAPFIESNYSVDTTRRVLAGHSLGGFFTLYSMIDNSQNIFFQNVISSSASMGIGENNALFLKEDSISQQINSFNCKLYMGCGEFVGGNAAVMAEFENRLSNRNYIGFESKMEIFTATHGSDMYPTLRNGLHYIFN